MASIKIPTPLRAYTDNQAEITVEGATIGEALKHLVAQYADLETHLFQDGKLRSFVNIYLADEDIRFLSGLETKLPEDAKLRIIPTIAGGNDDAPRLDANALKFGNGATIVLLLVAFILGAPLLVLFVAVAQLLGGLALPFAPYRLAYQQLVSNGIFSPRVVIDNAEPHRFAMLVGALFNGVGGLLLLAGAGAGWALVWIVIVLANLNFWLNFCVGCLMYYQLNRLGVPYFTASPIQES